MFFPETLLNSPMFGIGLTIIVYVFCELIVNRFELNIIPPFVLACPIIMGIIYFQSPHITYEQYAAGANFINFLLGPATVALALPLYRNRQTLKNNLAVIVSGVVVATVIGIVAIFVCGKLFGAITGAAIADALQAQHGLTIDGKKLVLDQPIKSFGSYEVKARLGYEVSGTVYVHVIEEK